MNKNTGTTVTMKGCKASISTSNTAEQALFDDRVKGNILRLESAGDGTVNEISLFGNMAKFVKKCSTVEVGEGTVFYLDNDETTVADKLTNINEPIAYDAKVIKAADQSGAPSGSTKYVVKRNEPAAKIGSTVYYSLNSAVKQASAGATIELLRDIELEWDEYLNTDTDHQFPYDFFIDKDLTIDGKSPIDGKSHKLTVVTPDGIGIIGGQNTKPKVTFKDITLVPEIKYEVLSDDIIDDSSDDGDGDLDFDDDFGFGDSGSGILSKIVGVAEGSADLVLENVTFDFANEKECSEIYPVYISESDPTSTVAISGCTVKTPYRPGSILQKPLDIEIHLPEYSASDKDDFAYIGWKVIGKDIWYEDGESYTASSDSSITTETIEQILIEPQTGNTDDYTLEIGGTEIPIDTSTSDAAEQIDAGKLLTEWEEGKLLVELISKVEDEIGSGSSGGTANSLSIKVTVDVRADSDNEASSATKAVYEVDPYATVYLVKNGTATEIEKDILATKMLADDAEFNVRLPVPSDKPAFDGLNFLKVTHHVKSDSDPSSETLEVSYPAIEGPGSSRYVEIVMKSFSKVDLEATPVSITRSGTTTGYATLDEAIDAAQANDTIKLAAGSYTASKNPSTPPVTIEGAGFDTTTITYSYSVMPADTMRFKDVQVIVPLEPTAAQIQGWYGSGYTFELISGSSPNTYKIKKTCTITFVNYDNSLLEEVTVDYDDTPVYPGATPTRPADAQSTSYTFAGWDSEIVPATGDKTYKATFTGTPRTYTIIFNNYNGHQLQKSQFAYGIMPTYTGPMPEKPADAQHAYVFSGWTNGTTPGIADVTGDATYTAVFQQVPRNFTATFINWDGTVLYQRDYASGSEPSYPYANPTRPADSQYTYTFSGWSPAISRITSNVTYTAQYTTTPVEYTVTFKNWNGTTLQTSKVAYGTVPNEPTTTPTRPSSGQYAYQFTGWSPTLARVTGDATYTAQFKEVPRYSKVVFRNWDDTVLQTLASVEFGTVPTYSGTTPVRAADEKGSYKFSGWTPAVTAVAGADQTYTAAFDITYKKYTVTFLNDDGTVLQTSEVEYGTTPAYTSRTPSKASTAEYTYAFAGWTPSIAAVTGNATYKATYTPAKRTYTIKFLDDDGSVLQTSEVEYGATPVYKGKSGESAPTKASTSEYTYSFAGWTPSIASVTKDASYTATYKRNARTYSVKFVNWDGTVLFETPILPGLKAYYAGPDPTRPADGGYSYKFTGWSPELGPVNEATTYTAQYEAIAATASLFRLYNRATGEHLYTADPNEYKVLSARAPWEGEGFQGSVPLESNPMEKTPVWRLFNEASGEHHYTADANEVLVLVRQQGWKGEGIMCYVPVDEADFGSAMYRLNNPGLAPFAHLFTTDPNEVKVLLGRGSGWQDEGIAWHCLK